MAAASGGKLRGEPARDARRLLRAAPAGRGRPASSGGSGRAQTAAACAPAAIMRGRRRPSPRSARRNSASKAHRAPARSRRRTARPRARAAGHLLEADAPGRRAAPRRRGAPWACRACIRPERAAPVRRRNSTTSATPATPSAKRAAGAGRARAHAGPAVSPPAGSTRSCRMRPSAVKRFSAHSRSTWISAPWRRQNSMCWSAESGISVVLGGGVVGRSGHGSPQRSMISTPVGRPSRSIVIA